MSFITFISLENVKAITSLSTTTIYRFIATGKFPHSINLGGRRVAWVEAEVQAWIESKTMEAKCSFVSGKPIWTVPDIPSTSDSPSKQLDTKMEELQNV